jgi:tellurite resistance protein TehA-like permease
MDGAESGLQSRLATAVETFFPGYFALVMATGIVSLATHFLVSQALAIGLLIFNVVAYIVLWCFTLARLTCRRSAMIFDLTHHARSVTFLTTVAGTMVLGSQFAILTPYMGVARSLWMLGVFLWLLLTYTFFTAITVRTEKPTIQEGINGAWLLVTVATESICVLGTLVAPTMPSPELVYFAALCAYLIGAMFYIVFITLVFYRWCFFCLRAETLTPPYWINMGALAITTLAGARLLLSAETWPFLDELSGFLKGFTLFFWATGAWWIPLLVVMGVWRHGVERVPIKYDPQYWSLVFPLGMFTVATVMLVKATGLAFLMPIPQAMVYVALVAWAIVFIGMIRGIARVITG